MLPLRVIIKIRWNNLCESDFFKVKICSNVRLNHYDHLSDKLAQLVADEIMGLNLMSWFIWIHTTGANKFHD